MKTLVVILMALVSVSFTSATTINSQTGGNWNAGATWVGGNVPGAGDDVVIVSGHIVIIDINNAVCNNISISGSLQFANNGTASGITINGDLSISSTGKFRCVSLSPTGAYVAHSLTVYGNITNTSGGVIDFRTGSNGTTGNGANMTLTGATTTTISLISTTYQNAIEEFNAIYISKTSGAKVVLNSGNLFMSNNGSVDTSKLVFVSGIIETGSNMWVILGTAARCAQGATSTSYLNGIMARGLTNTASATSDRDFYIGDGTLYRPITVRFIGTAVANATGHYCWAKIINGSANSGSSVLNGGIDTVSSIRYYQVGYEKGATGQEPVKFVTVTPSYNTDDGVSAGNTDLRVAYSIDNRATWNGNGPTTHTTSLTSPPTTIKCDTILPNISLTSGTSFFVSLAKATGTSTNALPVELVSFYGTPNHLRAELSWSTATEINNYGFDVERKVINGWTKVGFVEGAGSSNSTKEYAYTDQASQPGEYVYRLKQIDKNGAFRYSSEVHVVVGSAAKTFTLSENYPNPFNPSTSIEFTVPENGMASLEVFNMLGQNVATLFNGSTHAGIINRVTFDASQLPSGLYFSRLQFKNQTMVHKMLLMK